LRVAEPGFCKLNQPAVDDAGVKFVKHAEKGDAPVVAAIVEVTGLGHADDCSRDMVYCF
jgi:hypothetical protein